MVAKTHGGLQDEECEMSWIANSGQKYRSTHAASKSVTVVELNPSVAVNLNEDASVHDSRLQKLQNSMHVGKKLTKLSPRSCEQFMTAKMDTFQSRTAIFRPSQALTEVALGSYQ